MVLPHLATCTCAFSSMINKRYNRRSFLCVKGCLVVDDNEDRGLCQWDTCREREP